MNGQVDFIRLLQEFNAVGALGGNALRNQERGVVRAIQSHLVGFQLRGIPSHQAVAYEQWLDDRTEGILAALQVQVRPWGTARKAINLFMRACICDHYLRREYHLERIEPLAEIPLDRIVATALKQRAGRGRLPAWPGLKHLGRPAHREFQRFASEYAQELHLPARVYLDNYLWLRNR